jgi:hypothetical protein
MGYMQSLCLSLLLIALATASAFAQSGPAGAGCGTGSTVAHPFVGTNGLAGNMFDIAPSVDMTIECMDLNWADFGMLDVAVWFCPGTVVGNDVNQLGTWQIFASGSAPSAGIDRPTRVTLQSSGQVFLAGSTYGIYVQVVNYASLSGYLRYTDGGPNEYPGTHCTLTTYYGKADGLTSTTFAHRAWNGVLYTAESLPELSIVGTCPGLVNLTFTNASPNGPVAILAGPAGSFVKPGDPCAGSTLAIRPPRLMRMITASPSGSGVFNLNAPALACGRTMQVLDLQSCKASNALVL